MNKLEREWQQAVDAELARQQGTRHVLERTTSLRQYVLFAILVVLLACCHSAHADEVDASQYGQPEPKLDAVWKRQPKMEWAFDAALVADALTTLDIKNHPGFTEANSILGKHPSDARIVGYTVAVAVIHMAITRQMVDGGAPPKLIAAWEWLSTGVEVGCVGHNLSIGLRFAL